MLSLKHAKIIATRMGIDYARSEKCGGDKAPCVLFNGVCMSHRGKVVSIGQLTTWIWDTSLLVVGRLNAAKVTFTCGCLHFRTYSTL